MPGREVAPIGGHVGELACVEGLGMEGESKEDGVERDREGKR